MLAVDNELGKLKLPKFIKKPIRRIGAATAGVVTMGLIKPKVLRIKSRAGRRVYRTAGRVGKVAGAAAAIYFSAGTLGPILAKGGALAGVIGGKLLGFFKSKGMTDAAASIAADAVMKGQQPIPPELTAEMQATGLTTQAGMFGPGNMPIILLLGAGGLILGITMFGGKKGGKRHGR